MTTSLRVAVVAALVAGLDGRAAAAPETPPPAAGEERPWTFSASAYAFLVPDPLDHDYVNPNVTADHARGLHLEARYNYEATETGSAWIGWTFAAGKDLALEITPMLGGVFGSVDGIAPGWLLSLAWRSFSLSSQGEYLFDASGSEGNFLYIWSELDWSPVEWLRTGLAIQRTKAYETELDVQRGVLVGVSYREIELAAYLFDLGWTDPTFVLAVVATF